MVIMTLLGEQIPYTSVFKGYEILMEGVILKANLILLEISDFDVILEMDWLFNHRTSMYCFTKKFMFRKPGFSKLEFEGDRRVLPKVISTLSEGIPFFSVLVRISTGVFRCTVSDLSIFLNFFKIYIYIYMKNIKMILNIIHLD